MFKNVMVYRLTTPWTTTQAKLEEALEANRFVECGASQEKSVGWIEPRGEAHGALVEIVGGQWLAKLQIEVKTVPGSVVKRKVQDQLDAIEATTGRKPGKKEKRELAEDARQALLPMAFTKQSTVLVWIDPRALLLITDAGSNAKADEVMTHLIKAVDGLAVQLVNTQTSPAAAMAHWLGSREAPQGFSVDRECELKAADESKAVVRYTRHALDTDEVMTHLIKAVDGLAVQLVNTQTSPAAAMAHWLGSREAPQRFSVDRECELKAADESKAVVRYTRHALDTDEVSQHIAMGKVPTRLALTWNDRVSFVLTEALQLKKVAFLDVVFEGSPASPGDKKDDGFDADAAIATGELVQLIPDLLEALGGEMPQA